MQLDNKQAENLKKEVLEQVKKVFVKSLSCIEIKFGKDFAGYSALRKEILDTGNDVCRTLVEIIDNKYIIGSRGEEIEIVFKDTKHGK